MAKKKKKNEKEAKNAWEKLNLREQQFLLYYLGIEKPPTGYDCYANRTRSYFYAYNPDLTDAKVEKTTVDDDGNVVKEKVWRKEYKTAGVKGWQLYEKDKIQEARAFLRDEVDPIATIKEMSRQKRDMGIAFRASKELLELEGDARSDDERAFSKFIKRIANADNDDGE